MPFPRALTSLLSLEEVIGGGGGARALLANQTSCGLQTETYPKLCEYGPPELLLLTGAGNPEFSGGTFDGRTCTHWEVGDEGFLNELDIKPDGTVTLLRSIEFIGGSGDLEGICIYDERLVIVDERERDVTICDVATTTTGGAGAGADPLFKESANCRVLGLTNKQKNDPSETSAKANKGFEGVACDPDNGKLYVIQEKNPMRVWSVDVATGDYETLIDVESKADWKALVTDLSGITFDPMNGILYILSQESGVVIASSLDGELVVDSGVLNVSMANQPEGIYHIPATGALFVASEPNEIFRYTRSNQSNCLENISAESNRHDRAISWDDELDRS